MKNPRLKTLTRSDIEKTAQDLQPDPVRLWACGAGGKWFPVKQLVQEAANRLPMATVPRATPADFTSHQAAKLLRDRGFEVRYVDPDAPVETKCPVLGWPVLEYAKTGDWTTFETRDTGLKYRVTGSAVSADSKDRLTDDGRVRLRKWLVERRPSATDPRVTDFPMITVRVVEEIGLQQVEE